MGMVAERRETRVFVTGIRTGPAARTGFSDIITGWKIGGNAAHVPGLHLHLPGESVEYKAAS